MENLKLAIFFYTKLNITYVIWDPIRNCKTCGEAKHINKDYFIHNTSEMNLSGTNVREDWEMEQTADQGQLKLEYLNNGLQSANEMERLKQYKYLWVYLSLVKAYPITFLEKYTAAAAVRAVKATNKKFSAIINY